MPPRPKGFKHSEETLAKMREARKKQPPTMLGKKHSEETKAKMSAASKGKPKSVEHRARLSAVLKGRRLPENATQRRKGYGAEKAHFNFTGGKMAVEFAKVLEPAGFIREYCVKWGPRINERFILDFVHLEAKVNIEIDGRSHRYRVERDALRDYVLTTFGWRIIRIKI